MRKYAEAHSKYRRRVPQRIQQEHEGLRRMRKMSRVGERDRSLYHPIARTHEPFGETPLLRFCFGTSRFSLLRAVVHNIPP